MSNLVGQREATPTSVGPAVDQSHGPAAKREGGSIETRRQPQREGVQPEALGVGLEVPNRSGGDGANIPELEGGLLCVGDVLDRLRDARVGRAELTEIEEQLDALSKLLQDPIDVKVLRLNCVTSAADDGRRGSRDEPLDGAAME